MQVIYMLQRGMSRLYLETNGNKLYASYAHDFDVKNLPYLIVPKGMKFTGSGKLGLTDS